MQNQNSGEQNAPNKPYRTIIHIKAEISDVLPNGQISGVPITKRSKAFVLSGNSLAECESQLNHFLDQIPQILDTES